MAEGQGSGGSDEKAKVSEAQIAFVLKQAEDGMSVAEVCRKTGISEATFYAWRKKYAGRMPTEMRRLRQLEEETAKLKRLVADPSLDTALWSASPDMCLCTSYSAIERCVMTPPVIAIIAALKTSYASI